MCRRRPFRKSWLADPAKGACRHLPAFNGKLKPDTTGLYRILNNEKGGVKSVVPGLDPGEYLVNDAGEVVYKMERNFPADLRAPNDAELGPLERIKGPRPIWIRKVTAPGSGPPAGGPAQRYLVNYRRRSDLSRRPRLNGTSSGLGPDGSARQN